MSEQDILQNGTGTAPQTPSEPTTPAQEPQVQKTQEPQLGGRDMRINKLTAEKYELQAKVEAERTEKEIIAAELEQERIARAKLEMNAKYPHAYKFIEENPELMPRVDSASEFVSSMEKIEQRLAAKEEGTPQAAPAVPEAQPTTTQQPAATPGFVAPTAGEPVVESDLAIIKNMPASERKGAGYKQFKEAAARLLSKQPTPRV